jgi:hypothetical protein
LSSAKTAAKTQLAIMAKMGQFRLQNSQFAHEEPAQQMPIPQSGIAVAGR